MGVWLVPILRATTAAAIAPCARRWKRRTRILAQTNDDAEASFPAGNPNANNDIVGTSVSPVDPKLDPNGLQNNGGPTQTIALLFNSPAIDKGTATGLTGSLTTDGRETGFRRSFDYPSITNAAGAAGADGTDIGALELLTPFSLSRKMHAGEIFELKLTLTTGAGVECRTAGISGDHQVVLTFPRAITATGASVTSGVGSVSAFAVQDAEATVNLTGVADAQTVVLRSQPIQIQGSAPGALQ